MILRLPEAAKHREGACKRSREPCSVLGPCQRCCADRPRGAGKCQNPARRGEGRQQACTVGGSGKAAAASKSPRQPWERL